MKRIILNGIQYDQITDEEIQEKTDNAVKNQENYICFSLERILDEFDRNSCSLSSPIDDIGEFLLGDLNHIESISSTLKLSRVLQGPDDYPKSGSDFSSLAKKYNELVDATEKALESRLESGKKLIKMIKRHSLELKDLNKKIDLFNDIIKSFPNKPRENRRSLDFVIKDFERDMPKPNPEIEKTYDE